MTKNSALFIGTGASLGVPVIGCECATCRSHDPKNKRLRSSLILNWEGKRFLIDAGPDFRQQALRYEINYLDGVLLTHAHEDHIAGIDDLRIYYFQNHTPLPCLASKETAKDLYERFHFIFKPRIEGKERIRLEVLPEDRGEALFEDIPIRYFTYEQMGTKVLGFRFGNFAYLTDIKTYSPAIFEELQGVEILVLSALRMTPSQMHFTVDEAVDFVKNVGSCQTYLTHLSHDLEHEKTNAYLPKHIQLAYDGLKITL